MTVKRREFLIFLGATAGGVALNSCQQKFTMPFSQPVNSPKSVDNLAPGINFQPVKGPMPLLTSSTLTETGQFIPISSASTQQQMQAYSAYEVADDLLLPEGFTYDIVAAWGDKVGDSHFGYNNDYLSFVETGKNQGLLTVNFEYISAKPWIQSYQKVIGKSLPFAKLEAAAASAGKAGVNAFSASDKDQIKKMVAQVSKAALIEVGIGVISIKINDNGKWVRTPSPADRRITGISGLEDGRYLKATGPAVAVFNKKGKGYSDKLGSKIIGTFSNCAGGTTPWGTVFSAEENIQNFVPEPVFADGTSFDPSKKNFYIDAEEIGGLGNVFGLAGNKYGWMVEVDPANPKDYGTKHTWLGRCRHEAVGIRVVAGKPLAFYSGCDRRSGHIYKFVSKNSVKNPKDKANSQLLTDGMLYAAKFNADGTGRWIPLKTDTPVNPDLPSLHGGGMINLPLRPAGGFVKVEKDAEAVAFKQKFKTLNDLYEGTAKEKQGAILIDAHYAASAAGATCTARPEDTEIAPDGSLYITFTSGSASDSDGGPDLRIFQGKDGKSYEYGWIMRLVEEGNEPSAMTFQWKMFATGGEPAEGGLGFSNPDNLLIDKGGNVWMVNDMSSDKLNAPVAAGRVDKDGKPISQSNLRGLYGNNAIWFLPASGPNAGEAFLFGIGPMECETTGPFFTEDEKTLFLAIQHPGEINGMRKDMAVDDRNFAMKTIDGKEFLQTRKVPVGSNWPLKKANNPPKPAVVAIRRVNSQPLT
ncbi:MULTISPECIES: alkaline phosphatase PhoX [unclassified Microcoleus]|uniref:PhoX family protein n=1 Tax=unclassified Microcoleus TaxID=2642155 RepID=UPI0025D73853|nr:MULTISPECIES: alkaline phosphatase PhoX [unclassified Microcoleus]